MTQIITAMLGFSLICSGDTTNKLFFLYLRKIYLVKVEEWPWKTKTE